MMKERKQGRGFTLIELLVVIGIIGALVAILLPSLRKARTQAKRTVCASQLHDVGVAMQSYLTSESNERMPYASFMPSMGSFPLMKTIYIADVLAQHLGNQGEALHCPQDLDGGARPAPNEGKSYFESERSSYEYRMRIGGLTMKEVAARFERFTGKQLPENAIWILRDYENFHGKGGTIGARRYLYVDGHVTDFEN